ncbi:VCBS repeat-containing protein [Aegicerativicinus sediminis]|uniref:VCBS repeat-containing protein n=1 Tax=Aegicerativicinus sediminis TaxID=2893202 RepID=UPI001E5E7391|nr:VCBS repeat-containing protein [Aegicerativicinus sediminis]
MNKTLMYFLVVSIIFSCSEKEGSLFKSIKANDSGLDFNNTLKETDELNILDYLYFYNGGGVAIGDINNDGLPDIYVSSNQNKNKLYLNKGNLNFEDITSIAGVAGNSSWNTGVSMADINADGLLDIYVNAVVGINGFKGHNELFINNGDLTFSEKSSDYGLDLDSFASSSAFLDYDLDGDLDIFILNHAIHTQESFGKAAIRTQRNYETGDRLMRNDNGKFIDVSEEAGIYGGVNGYGLGIAVSDFNKDGYPDIYVGNDFHEDDYYYINQKDGTFKESLKENFGHISRFSMGNDVADINHDGWPDLISLDMLAEDEKVLKTSEGDDSFQTLKMRTEDYGYHYQYTRNMLFVNEKGSGYAETALLSGLAATDWSWSVLIEDFNLDGNQDVFISNGIPKRPNDLDFIKFVSSEKIKNKINETKLVDQEAFDLMPTGKAVNYVFEGKKDLMFKNQTGNWIVADSLISGATALGDLDNDGDLDLIINNINSPLTLLENKGSSFNNFLKIKFSYSQQNPFGIGTKAVSYHNGIKQYKELYTVRGFQSSSEPTLYFGYGKEERVDSLIVIWPDFTSQKLENIETKQTLSIAPQNNKPYKYFATTNKLFEKVNDNLGINFAHEEDGYIDFNRQKLIPFEKSDAGPAVAIGDLNSDGNTDIFFGSSKFKKSVLFLGNSEGFIKDSINSMVTDSITEQVSAAVIDLDNDGINELFLGNGGADFYGKNAPLLDAISKFENGKLIEKTIPDLYNNASIIAPYDFDGDGDLDVFVGNSIITGNYGKSPDSYLLINENGELAISDLVPKSMGLVNHAIWSDIDGDNLKDLIVVGEWFSPRFFINEKDSFKEITPIKKPLNGLWQQILEFDFDHDGDNDYLLGNWGLNSKFKASIKYPLRMYYGDFDNNGQTETILANYKNDGYYPILSLDELSSQMVFLKKKFNSYKSFAGKKMEDIFEDERLENAEIFEVNILASGYLENNNGEFSFHPFANQLQISPIKAFVDFDFDRDGKKDVLAAGNYFGVTPYHGRFDSFSGALINSNGKVVNTSEIGLNLKGKSVRHLNILNKNGINYLLVTTNNDKAEVYKILD